MALPTQITVIEIGAEQDHRVPYARSIEPEAITPQAQARGNLYIFLNLSGAGAGRARLSRQVLNTIQMVYYEQTAGSITGSLTQAFLTAHSVVRRANAIAPQAIWQGSAACLIVRGRDLFIGHAGPALSFIAHPDVVDLFPAEAGEINTYLGDDEPPDADFYQTQLRGDTRVILAGAEWLEHTPAKTLAAVAAAPDLTEGVAYLREIAEETGLTALVVAIKTEPEAGPQAPEGEAQAVESRSIPLPPVSPAMSVSAPTPGTRTREPSPPPAREEVTPAPLTPRRLATSVPRSLQQPSPPPQRVTETTPVIEPVPETARLPRQEGRSLISLFHEARRLQQAATPTVQPQQSRSRWPLILALLIPLLTALLVGAVSWQRSASRVQQYRALIEKAQAQILAAAASNDPATAREMFNQTYSILDEAELMRPSAPEIQQLRLRIQEQLERTDQIQSLYLFFALKEFGEGERDPGRVVANGDNVFVLDRGLDQVDHYRLGELGDTIAEENPEPLLRKGQVLGGKTVGEIVDMVWVPAGDGRKASALLVLDADGNLWQWMENLGLTSIAIAAANTWRYPQKVSTYFGRLYLMDTQANTLLRYSPTEDGYSTPPELYFAPEIAGNVDLGGAMDMAIDGNVWILFADGRILKFFQGKAQPFELSGFPGRLLAPVALVSGLNEGTPTDRLYIGDASGGRIAEFDKNGRFIRQMRPSDPKMLQDMRSLFVDEAEKAFYILTGKGLYKAQIPPEQGLQ